MCSALAPGSFEEAMVKAQDEMLLVPCAAPAPVSIAVRFTSMSVEPSIC